MSALGTRGLTGPEQMYRLRVARKAHWLVAQFKRNGRLVVGPCEKCGSRKKVHAHHDDYTKPHVVRWLCKDCHAEWHMYNDPIYPPHALIVRKKDKIPF